VQDDGIKQIYGSRERDGDVPLAGWFGGHFDVHWALPGRAHEVLRARQ